MTDYYKTALEVLTKILQEENYDHWAKWMREDLKLWETNKSVEHHLHAYGGMGSFNDIIIGKNDDEGIWKGHVFGYLQTLAYGLAKGDSLKSILEGISNRNNSKEISGWRCRNCGSSRMNDRDINLFIADYFVPLFFVKYVQEGRLNEVIDIRELIDSEEVMNKKIQIKFLINKANIIQNLDDNWLWNCPKCGSSEVCAYRWNVLEGGSKIVEGDDNLLINS
jgi:hypothetical protein